jgi:hypothetical protein
MSRHNLATKQGKIEAFRKLSEYSNKGIIIDIEYVKNTRTSLQNRALHLYYKHIANALLEVGYDFCYSNPFTGEIISIPYTGDLVKNYIWRPLQVKIFEIESTKELTTEMINNILEAISLWLSEKNIAVNFPNKIDLLIKQMNNEISN